MRLVQGRGHHSFVLPKAHESFRNKPDVWLEKYQSRTKSIDGLPTEATDRYFGPKGR